MSNPFAEIRIPAVRQAARSACRPGFTLVECSVALAIIVIVGAIVAQCLAWSLRERARTASHQAALELAANTLEAAPAQPFDKLDKAWADAQSIPSDMEGLLPQGKIVVTVDPEKGQPNTRRVHVEVRWQAEFPQSVSLTTLLSAGEAKKAGGEK